MSRPTGFAGRHGPLIVVTDRRQAAAVAGRTLPDVVGAAIEGGARTVLLREKDLARRQRRELAEALAELLGPVDGALLVAGDPALAAVVGAAGVHLAAGDAWPVVADRRQQGGAPAEAAGRLTGPRYRAGAGPGVVGRSCHSVDDLRAALTNGADYASLSPIWPSSSKPGYGPALGLGELAAACAAVPELPVVALGGVTPGRAAGCRAAGAAAVAVMGEVMRAGDPAGCVRSLIAELQGVGAPRTR